MPARFRHAFTAAVITLVCAASALYPPLCPAQTSPPIPVEEWLRGPDRRDFPWKVRLLRPQLTFQQRYLLQVRADLHVDVLQTGSEQRDLHFLVKVADERGRWFHGGDYTHYTVPPKLDGGNEIQFTSGLYLRPGKYVIAVIVYDSVTGQGNLRRQVLRVSAPKHEPLAQLDRDLPTIEFLRDVPRDSLAERTWPVADDTWALAHGREWLPVRNPRPVRVDVVLNLSNWLDPQLRGPVSPMLYRQRVGRLLQIGSVLSHLAMARGCVHVSAVDIHNARIIFDRAAADTFDWDQAQQTIFRTDQNIVDVSTLEQRSDTGLFFRRFLSDVLYNSGGCASADGPVRRAMIIAGATHLFPAETRMFGVWPEMPCDCQFYYLRADANPLGDDIGALVKRVKTRQFNFNQPRQFRRALAQLITDLESDPRGGLRDWLDAR